MARTEGIKMRDVKPEPIPQEVLDQLNKKPKQSKVIYMLGFFTGVFIFIVFKLYWR